MKNSADQGECYPPRPSASVDNTLRDLLNSSYYINTCEIPGFLLLLKNHIFIARSERTIFIFHM